MNQKHQQNNNYIKKTKFQQKFKNTIQNQNNFMDKNYNNKYYPPQPNHNLFEQERNNNQLNFQENQMNESINSPLQAYLNGKININTTNINQNIYNNNIYPDNNLNEMNNNINQQYQLNPNSYGNNNINLRNNGNKTRRERNKINNNNINNNFNKSLINDINQINYNQLLNLQNNNNNNYNFNNNINNRINNNDDLELIKLKLLYLNYLKNNNPNITDISNNINEVNNQNSNMAINPSLLEQLRILKEENLKKEYLLNLLQLNNQIENNKKLNLLNYLNGINNQNQIYKVNNNLPNLGSNNLQNFRINDLQNFENNNLSNLGFNNTYNSYNNENNNNFFNNQNNALINQLYRKLISIQLSNQNIQNYQMQNYNDNNLNNIRLNNDLNTNNFQRNIIQQNNNRNNNIKINSILNNLQNNQNQIEIQNHYSQNENNNQIKIKTNNNKQKQRQNHISNSMNLYKLDNETIVKEAYNLTKGQMGCRFLQKKIEEDTKFALDYIYPIILKHLIEVINDKFGNYLIQKFLEYLSQKEIFLFINSIKDNFLNIGLNQYGTRVIQKLLDVIKISGDEYSVNNYKTMIALISPYIIQFSNDLNGCHIIQNIFLSKTFPNKFLFEFYHDNIIKISNDKNGCCFLQKCIDKLYGEELNNILESVFINIKEIIIDKYGNYVVQYIIKNLINVENENQKEIKNFNWYEIFKFILEDFVNYSNQKYSSNVIEKLFTIEELKPKLIEKLKHPDIVRNLLLEKYGNYVVQKGLHFAEKKDRDVLLKIIADLSDELKNIDFGNKLMNKLMTKYPELIKYMNDKDKKAEELKGKSMNNDGHIYINNKYISNDDVDKVNNNQKIKNNDTLDKFCNDKKYNKTNTKNNFK